jgi:hypothetical protein
MLSLVDLTESDWQLFDDQVFKLGSAQDSSPGQFGVRAGCQADFAAGPHCVCYALKI